MLASSAFGNTNQVANISTNNPALVSDISTSGYETLAASVTNKPVITSLKITPNYMGSTSEQVTLVGTNFVSNSYNYYIQHSTNRVDWIQTGMKFPVAANQNVPVSNSVIYSPSSSYHDSAFFRINGKPKIQ